jgi:hypothetical protein
MSAGLKLKTLFTARTMRSSETVPVPMVST